MAKSVDELHEPVVVEIDDEFSRLPPEEQVRRTQEWLDSLRTDEPLELPVSGAQILAEARAEMGW